MPTLETLNPWRAPEPLSELTLQADWDSITSMILSLRIHAFEYGTIPVWNYMFCGGRPELAMPFSWAWIWPSAFAYLFSPNTAIIVVWIVMTGIGLMATRALFLRWSCGGPGATVGAVIYALSGLFATRFNAGHMTFAFFHLVPVLMLVFEHTFKRARINGPDAGACALAIAASFLFFTAALPHGLIHFYPAFMLAAVVRTVTAARRFGVAPAARAFAVVVAANMLGALMAAYKIWPVIEWQFDAPRVGVRLEAYDLGQILTSTLTFVPDYFQVRRLESWFVYSSWEYNAFVGPMTWLLAAFGAVGVFARNHLPRGPIWIGVLLVVIGTSLSLGSDSPWSLARYTRELPVINGIRAFVRFQVLVVFGLSVLAAEGFRRLLAWRLSPAIRKPLLIITAAALTVPPVAQATVLVWNILAQRNSDILALYSHPGASGPMQQRMLRRKNLYPRHETSLIDAGYWIANCKSDMKLPGIAPFAERGKPYPISIPPPSEVVIAGPSALRLSYADASTKASKVFLNVRIGESSRLDVPSFVYRKRLAFEYADLRDGDVTLRTSFDAPREGAQASALAVLASAGWLGWRATRERNA